MFGLIEFPADDIARARQFWEGLLGVPLAERQDGEGQGLQTRTYAEVWVGLHERGAGPGDRASIPYFTVPDLPAALTKVVELGGSVVHPGKRWAICCDTESTPFGLAQHR